MAMKQSSSLTGSAGVYYVAARLNARGLQCAPTFGNVPSVDILASTVDGATVIPIQVKTTMWGLRSRGRGKDKKPHHYEWDIGWKSAQLNVKGLVFALVDLQGFTALPDVFLVPSSVINKYFVGGDPKTWPRARYHETIENLARYKNTWDRLVEKAEG